MAEIAAFRRNPGFVAPSFSLPGTDGKVHRLEEFADRPFLLVTFWCNHCPYVRAWEGRMIDIGRRYGPRGVGIVLINSNDISEYPQDRPEEMARRAKEKDYPFPYLFDERQEVARAYGAEVTPHPMLFGPDRRLLFQGRIDDDHEHPERVRRRYLAEALDRALAHQPIPEPTVPVRGCSIKWKA